MDSAYDAVLAASRTDVGGAAAAEAPVSASGSPASAALPSHSEDAAAGLQCCTRARLAAEYVRGLQLHPALLNGAQNHCFRCNPSAVPVVVEEAADPDTGQQQQRVRELPHGAFAFGLTIPPGVRMETLLAVGHGSYFGVARARLPQVLAGSVAEGAFITSPSAKYCLFDATHSEVGSNGCTGCLHTFTDGSTRQVKLVVHCKLQAGTYTSAPGRLCSADSNISDHIPHALLERTSASFDAVLPCRLLLYLSQ